MIYGVNQADACWDFALGPNRDFIRDQLRAIDTRLIRLFLFDKGAPDPVKNWHLFAAHVRAVLDAGAVPMVTFAKFRRPLDDARAIRWFAEQCADVVWGCMDQWGPSAVRDWYWCVWNEPNSDWIGGGLSFDQYRRIYEAVAERILRWLGPFLNGRKPLIGGPSIEGFQPFWMDWALRFVTEIDNALIGFLDWHMYGDWREHGENNAPRDGAAHRALMMGLVSEYQTRARAIGRLLRGRDILNICGEVNCHSHYRIEPRRRFNQSIFGATYYASSLLHLMRGGADVEMFWTGTEDDGGYGMMGKHGAPHPAFHAKKLCAQYVRHNDRISFPTGDDAAQGIDMVVAHGDDGRRSILMVHQSEQPATHNIASLAPELAGYHTLLKIDGGTGNRIVRFPFDGTVQWDGYGVAVATNQDPDDHVPPA
jgi:hypothetical protein